MIARPWLVGGLVVVAAIAIIAGRGGGGAQPAAVETSEAVASPRPWSTPAARPTLAGLDDEVPAQVAAAAAPTPTDAAGYAASLADRLCACADGTCIDEVNRRYGGQLGQVGVTHDTRAIHDAFVRAHACTTRIRAATPATAP